MKLTWYKALAWLGILMILNSCSLLGSGNQTVHTGDYEGVILSVENARELGPLLGNDITEFWLPTEQDVANLEAGLPGYLQANEQQFENLPVLWERLNKYKRQYVGYVEEGRQVIYVNFFYNPPDNNWKKEFIMVMDGGDSYFNLRFQVETGQFYGLQVNRSA